MAYFPNNLANTRKALARFDEPYNQSRRQAQYEAIKTNEDASAYFGMLKAEEDEVRRAFYKDTKDINSLDNCMLIGLYTLRKWCSKIK